MSAAISNNTHMEVFFHLLIVYFPIQARVWMKYKEFSAYQSGSYRAIHSCVWLRVTNVQKTQTFVVAQQVFSFFHKMCSYNEYPDDWLDVLSRAHTETILMCGKIRGKSWTSFWIIFLLSLYFYKLFMRLVSLSKELLFLSKSIFLTVQGKVKIMRHVMGNFSPLLLWCFFRKTCLAIDGDEVSEKCLR